MSRKTTDLRKIFFSSVVVERILAHLFVPFFFPSSQPLSFLCWFLCSLQSNLPSRINRRASFPHPSFLKRLCTPSCKPPPSSGFPQHLFHNNPSSAHSWVPDEDFPSPRLIIGPQSTLTGEFPSLNSCSFHRSGSAVPPPFQLKLFPSIVPTLNFHGFSWFFQPHFTPPCVTAPFSASSTAPFLLPRSATDWILMQCNLILFPPSTLRPKLDLPSSLLIDLAPRPFESTLNSKISPSKFLRISSTRLNRDANQK